MEGFSSVTPVTGLNRPNTGKEDDDYDWVGHGFELGRNVALFILERYMLHRKFYDFSIYVTAV
jgi:hypothetical protein